MSREFEDVIKFNQEVVKLEQTQYLDDKQLKWFKGVIEEELGEFEVANSRCAEAVKGIKNGLAVSEDTMYEIQADMVDALIDLIYFAYGRLYEIGTTPGEFDCMWQAIQEANMSKVKGNKGRGSDQDAIKPVGWKKPETKFIEYKKHQRDYIKQLDSDLQTTCDKNIQRSLFDTLIPEKPNLTEKVQTALSGEAESKLKSLDTEPYRSYVEKFNHTGPETNKLRQIFAKMPIEELEQTLLSMPSAELERTLKILHTPEGVKYDNGKPNLSLVFGGFAKALRDVGYVGTFGAKKYSPNGWKYVPELQERYMSALERHALDVLDGKVYDEETGRLSIAHVAWNALAVLQDSLSKMNYDAYNTVAIAKSNATLEKYFKAKKEQNNG